MRLYDFMPELTSAQAAAWICNAIVRRPRRMALRGAVLAEVAYVASPSLAAAREGGLHRASEPGTAAARLGRATAVVLSDLSGPARAQLRRRVPARSASPSES